jgi:uncharacterized membrane protein YphA (DoxX/SURF4 family)
MRWVHLGLRLALGALFLYAGLIKAGASEEFALALIPFTFVPGGWGSYLAVGLAVTEILAGVLILLPRVYPLGALLILGLCAVFIVALTWALANGIIVDCACFGRDEAPSAEKMVMAVVRDVVIVMAAATVLSRLGLPARASLR